MRRESRGYFSLDHAHDLAQERASEQHNQRAADDKTTNTKHYFTLISIIILLLYHTTSTLVMEKSFTVLDSWSSISEKTIFVLDRSDYFTKVSSGHLIDADFLKEHKKTAHLYANEPAIEPFDRSLWTCTVEAVVGYSRLLWDLFAPDQRCLSMLVVGPNVDPTPDKGAEPYSIEKICSWQDSDQNLEHLMKSLAKSSHNHQTCPPDKLLKTQDIASFPNCKTDSISVNAALDRAINELATLTSAQIERKLPIRSCDNNGRIVLISSFQDEQAINEVVSNFEQALARKNETFAETQRQATTNLNSRPINYCDLVIVNTFPIKDSGSSSKIGNANGFRPNLHYKIYSVESGRIIAGLLNNLCLQHHNLRSTTITGIPMKEEQNASSSSQYDVEIVHCSSIHEDIMNSRSPLFEGVVEVIDRNGFPCDTFKLSWCTPRTTTIELTHCVATSRITAVDVNSRPSACLTNFLLNGRAVMLEIFKSKSNRMTTHILASHNDELYIHSLPTMQQKATIADPPSISDNLGGKVGDYRLNDFTAFMKQHTLCKSHITDDPLNRTCNIIKRQTLYWPLTLGHTILFNVPHLLGRLLQLIPKESLNPSDMEECKKAIDNLRKFEHEGQALPSVTMLDILKSANTKGGGSKLEQLYRLLWNELEYFLRVHSTTPEHEVVLDHLLERNDKRSDLEKGGKRSASKVMEPLSPLKKAKFSHQLIPDIDDTSPSIQQTAAYYKTGMSLWQTWTSLYHHTNKHRNKLPFVGRLQSVNPQTT